MESPQFVNRLMHVVFGEYLLMFVAQQNKLFVMDVSAKVICATLSIPADAHVLSLAQLAHGCVVSGDTGGAILKWTLA